MKRRRLVGKQSANGAENEGAVPCCLENVWRRLSVIVRNFLDARDWCQLEALSPFWLRHAVGTGPWRALLIDRFGSHTFLQEVANMPDVRRWQKVEYFLLVSWRIVPGRRAAGIRLGLENYKLRTKPCNTVIPRYHIEEYLSPGQGYFFLDFKLIGGPVPPFERVSPFSIDLPIAHECLAFPGPIVEDEYDTNFTGQCLTLFTDGTSVKAVGCHIHAMQCAVMEIPERPDIKGISPGITCQQLLDKLGSTIDDVIFGWCNPGGPTIFFDQLPRVCFEVDAENGGLAEVDEFANYQDVEWLRPRLHFPIGAIFTW
ncbi:unnamed protein product [Symbiodinium pilosum]|uniref:Uncharacterized protein n=1 Tax=Symbiodinium pilosum TaxID=2952 RepID=A0A812LPC4_SYMPI|nr:unnamed protein product [Symbiodinium pilosum]